MTRKKIMTVFGTRPEAIKMAPLVHELRQYEELEPFVCVTAQHRQMLDQVLDIFSVTPDADLNVMKDRQTLTQITTRVLEGLDDVMKAEKPDMVLVHGDTTTTFAASLAALYNQIPVGHVEAGLRTWNKYSPYPEEMNRQLTGVISDLHFAPTAQAAENLKREDKRDATIYITGNTVIDALKTTVRNDYKHPVLEQFAGKKLILVTAHRRENLGEPMTRMFRAIRRLVDKHEDIAVVYPVHLNPAVQEAAATYLGEHNRIQLISPLGAVDFHNFMSRAHLILTDSGGVQEEAPAFGVPVLVLRDTTERPEGIEAGTLKLAGTDEERIFALADELLMSQDVYDSMAKAANPYGDGEASRRICEAILHYFGIRSEKPAPFLPKGTQQ
ncbi:UDP-N-acetylglucosamine 2-epimerase (non-hydrolyzing) [Aneurinibacillus aneurinilyticus]|uniref:UDP-N-acetylglucosamine 2-epimerase (non-hydrolyzing) n=3 Tax=Aneurinibacillus aneurinilyticus TaxID=1391 RepID=A0A848CVE7_ANEAE|nr:UDP-N-acetylglucosamine 2-epimerase (non-hydrolyzing) [Aneurinibacillus aneurinilyticus]MED0671923.1 UDP-N-acetylglucosamine 2-epimerase (non-hydrolyzing) [Aneurinibacillus aneurinilyticus]NME97512.1 UDP-N-acetylglucosamine 2-epimerase (non-hydrolyzing) [Aneurinibacillus aneurinilyticus]